MKLNELFEMSGQVTTAYHFTKTSQVPEILKNGLLVSKDSTFHGHKGVYLTSDTKHPLDLFNLETPPSWSMSCLKVDVNGLKLKVDPDFEQSDDDAFAWYFVGDIDSHRITDMGKVIFKKVRTGYVANIS